MKKSVGGPDAERRVFNTEDVEAAYRSGAHVSVPILAPGEILRVYGPGVVTRFDAEAGTFDLSSVGEDHLDSLRLDEIVDQPEIDRRERRGRIWDWIIDLITAPTRSRSCALAATDCCPIHVPARPVSVGAN